MELVVDCCKEWKSLYVGIKSCVRVGIEVSE